MERPPTAGAAPAAGAAIAAALWAVPAALVLARAAASVAPGMWAWGLNHARFLPAWGWALLALAAAALVPALARPLGATAAWAGSRLERGWAWPAIHALAGAGLVLALPDRAHFVGDALLRYDALQDGVPAADLSPQAFPLDVWIHWTVPSWLKDTFGLAPALVSRLTGALDAALLALLAIGFARRLGLTGAALAASAALVWWGGWLALFTGFGKAFSELTVAVAAVAVLGLDALRGRGLLALGLVGAAALALHRSAVALLPALAWALACGARESFRRGAGAWGRWQALGAAAAVALTAGWIAPRFTGAVRAFDTAHFAVPGESGPGTLARAFAALHLLDLANLVLFLVPLAPLVFLPPRAEGTHARDGRARVHLLALFLPFAAGLFLLRPAQGIPRDFDDYAAGAMALGLLVAARGGAALHASGRAAVLAPALILGAAAPVVQWLAVQAEPPRVLERARALSEERPLRSEDERARLWDWLGGRHFRAGDYAAASRDLARAAELTPSPRLLFGWARAAARAGDWDGAERAYRLLIERAPASDARLQAIGRFGLATIALQQRGDVVEARALLEDALGRWPEFGDARRLLALVLEEQRKRATAP